MFLLLQCLFLLGSRIALADIDLGDGSDTEPSGLYYNTGSFTRGSKFETNRNIVVNFLINGSEAYNYGSDPDKAFGFRRCFFNTTQNLCSDCLKRNWNTLNNTRPYAYGGRYWLNNTEKQSCYLRYENYQFLNVSSPTIPSPTPETIQSPISPTSVPSNTTTGSSSTSKTGIYVGVGLGVAAAVVLSIISAYFFFIRRPVRQLSRSRAYTRDLEVRSNDATVFRYETLRAATNGFSKGNELGQGGFGTVYKGVLSDGTEVAVKKLALQSRQGQQEFVNEITIITGIQHKNLVRLKGYCIEEERLLVYEFMENGSLDNMLFGLHGLAWDTRHAIMIGVARGLAYIHEDSHIQIVHRDIKAGNILLDKKLNPKVSDFGISKLFDQDGGVDGGHSSTKIAGTLGYLAPEYATRGRLTTKADVFSFGVVMLEIISGRRCNVETLPPNQQLLLEWVWNLRQLGKVEEVIDKRLLKDDTYSLDEALRAIHIALLCTHEDEQCRPIMSHVVAMLQGLRALVQLPSEPPRYFVSMNVLKLNSSFMTENSAPSVENTLTAR